MKVLIVNTLYYPNIIGGAERSVQFLAENLVKAGHKIVVVSAMPESGRRTNMINGVKTYYVGIKNVYWPFAKQKPKFLKPLWQLIDAYNPFMAQELDRVLAIEQPDLVHTNNISCFSAAVWSTVKKRNLPLVHTLRDYYALCPDSSMYRKGKNCDKPCFSCNLYSLAKHKASHCVDTVVGNSRFILEKHLQFSLFPHATPAVIFNAFENTSLITTYSNSEKLRIGFIGRLRGVKGIERLLTAVAHIPPDKIELVVAGNGTDRYETKLRQQSKDNVKYIGFVAPEELFKQIDVLVAPSLWHEPLPRTVFESYAYGIPVIGASRGGIPELIEEDKTGFLFDPDNTQELVTMLNKFLDNPKLAATMREACLTKAKEFLPQKIVAQYLAVYENTLEKS